MKKLLLVVLFLAVSCPCFALIIVNDDVLYDDNTDLYWYRHVFAFEGMTYFEIKEAVQGMAEQSKYDWRLADKYETWAFTQGVSGHYDYDPSIYFNTTRRIGACVTQANTGVDDTGSFVFDIKAPELSYERDIDGWTLSPAHGLDFYLSQYGLPYDTTFFGAWVVAEPVPEPLTLSLFALGLVFVRRRAT